MSAEENKSRSSTNRWLTILFFVVILAGGGTYFFHERKESALSDLERAKENYDQMKRDAPKVVDLQRFANARVGTSGTEEGAFAYLTRKFLGVFPKDRVTVDSSREASLGGWTETPYLVRFGTKRDDPIPRAKLVELLLEIQKERPDLKPRNMKMVFAGNDLESASIDFSDIKRAPK